MNKAPSNWMLPLSADLIWVFTGMRSLLERPSLTRVFMPARHDIHPVSVVASINAECRGCALTVFSGWRWLDLTFKALANIFTLGWSSALLVLHVSDRLLWMWWSILMGLASSQSWFKLMAPPIIIFSSGGSLTAAVDWCEGNDVRHTTSKCPSLWHLLHFLPYAGQPSFFLICAPCCPQWFPCPYLLQWLHFSASAWCVLVFGWVVWWYVLAGGLVLFLYELEIAFVLCILHNLSELFFPFSFASMKLTISSAVMGVLHKFSWLSISVWISLSSMLVAYICLNIFSSKLTLMTLSPSVCVTV